MQLCVSNYEKTFVSDISITKRFHSYLRSKKVHRPTVGPLHSDDGWAVEPVDMANRFVAAFPSVLVILYC